MHLIGINGFKESGKDTTFTIVYSLHAEARRAAFADKIKILAAMALGFTAPDEELIALMDECKERWVFTVTQHQRAHGVFGAEARFVPTVTHPVTNFTGRQYLQWLGARARDVFGPDFWVDQILPQPSCGADAPESRRAEAAYQGNQNQMEWRYPGAEFVCVTDVRFPNEAARIRALGGVVWEVIRAGLSSDGHSSEQPLPRELVDWQIFNDGDLALLRERTEEALGETLGV